MGLIMTAILAILKISRILNLTWSLVLMPLTVEGIYWVGIIYLFMRAAIEESKNRAKEETEEK